MKYMLQKAIYIVIFMGLIEYRVKRSRLHLSKGDFSKGERVIVVQQLGRKKQVILYAEI